jgi:hypothetical protein
MIRYCRGSVMLETKPDLQILDAFFKICNRFSNMQAQGPLDQDIQPCLHQLFF